MRPLAELIRPNIRTLAPYSTARDEYGGQRIDVWLDANESPYDNGVNRYPDPRQQRLREMLAARKGIAADRIFIGSGSDEAIDLAYRIFCRPGIDNAVSIAPTYGMYRVAAAVNDVELREVPLGDDFSLPVERLLAAADERSKLLWLCSPNNPTGNAFPATEIERLLRRFDGMVVLDEAYVDFADGAGFLPRLDEFPNLIVLQTLSKAWGMAGLRIGLAFAAREVAALFSRVKYPYNIPGPTQRAAEEMLGRDLTPQIAEIRSERRRLASELASCPCIERVYPSQTNFLLVRTPAPDALYDALIEAGIIVRNRSRAAGCEGCLRLTVGTTACSEPSKPSAHEKSTLHRPRRHADRRTARRPAGRQPRKTPLRTGRHLGVASAVGTGFRTGTGHQPGRAGHAVVPRSDLPARPRTDARDARRRRRPLRRPAH